MKKILLPLALVLSYFAGGQNNYDKAWDFLNQNKWTDASASLTEAKRDPATSTDAYITQLYLDAYHGKETEITDFASFFYPATSNPYPYTYALWMNQAVSGGYGKKRFPHQLKLLNSLLTDGKTPGTLVASANYQMGMHYLFSNEFDKSEKYYQEVGNIRKWQYTGPFENISHSGFYKDYGPLSHPEPGAVFKSLTNADVKWFTPADEIKDGWNPVIYQFNNNTAVVYAQNFVTSPDDQVVYCCAGASGSIKVWVNDELVISESEERTTELDTYISLCQLKKGVNRILVQLGYTDNNYANFTIRLTDNQLKPVKGITGSPVFEPYPRPQTGKSPEKIIPFSEVFFRDKIDKNPLNLVNYMLLADVYLRNNKVIEARNLLMTAIGKAQNNCLLKMKMAEVLIKENNRTVLLEEVEKIKQLDPESLLVIELKIKDDYKNQKYDEVSKSLAKRIQLFGEDETTASYELALLAQEKKYDELVAKVEKYYAKYSWNQEMIEMMYAVKKNVYKDNKGALAIFEHFIKENYNYKVYERYADILTELGENDKALKVKQQQAARFPYSPEELYVLSKYHYGAKQYDKADEYIQKSLSLAPYNEVYWAHLGDVYSEKKKTKEALDAYNQSLQYDPNQYEIINKIRRLNGKTDAYKLLAHVDIDSVVKADNMKEARNIDYGYYYILDQKDVILYPGGASEEYYISILRITNEKGVDRYKESSISYGNSQTLLIEKAEVIKKNQTRLEGEKNDNEVVFTNLEAGDVVVYKYRLRNYAYGRLAKEHWDRYYFNGQIYSVATRYNVFVPAGQPFYYQFNNNPVQPLISDVENFKKYSWELMRLPPDKDEPLMPTLADVSAILHVSTIPSWKEIANWYSDISNNKAEEDFEIIALYKQLFPADQKTLTQFQKGKIIYNYIESNIRYSSVSFRQSAFTPQRPSVTLTSRLGDCKDLSSLFVTLCRLAGISAQMVLIDTRESGQKQIQLPSVEFNHCIVKAELDKKSYYIELTDNYLPFTSLPNDVIGAVILEIPYRSNQGDAAIKLLQADNRQKDIVKRYIEMKPSGDDLQVTVQSVKYGTPSSSLRAAYLDLDDEKLQTELEKSIAASYKNNIKMLSARVKDLATLNDSAEYSYSYIVKNEIAEIGAIKTFRISYPDIVASLDKLSSDTRTFPIEYWSYEDVDNYETTINISAPAGTKFIEIPVSENFSFKDMKFSIQYILKAPGKLMLVRKFSSLRQNIQPGDYTAFKAFFEKIVKAEQKFIAYK
ncbi:MAG: DUF3857 domain-containing protein [Chitinophagaceae bacterium]